VRISKVEIRNFGPYDEAEVDLDRPGITLVDGVVRGVQGCSNNGAGKSALVDAVSFALYGRALRSGFSKDEVVRRGAKGGCRVAVTVEGDRTITVVRHRKDSKHKNQVHLYVDGEDATPGTSDMVDSKIEAMLSCDFRAFANSVAFGAREDAKGFLNAPESERKRLFDVLLGLERYVRAEQRAREHARIKGREVERIQGEIDKIEARASAKRETLDHLKAEQEDDDEDGVPEYQTLKARAVLRRKFRADMECALGEAKGCLRAAERAHARRMEAYDKQAGEHAEGTRALEHQVKEARTVYHTADGEARAVKSRLTKLDSVSGECPTCGRELSAAAKKRTKKEVEAEVARCESTVDAANLQLTYAQRQLESHEAAAPPVPDDALVIRAQAEVDVVEKQIEAFDREVDDLLRESRRARKYQPKQVQGLEQIESQIEALDQAAEEKRTELIEAQHELACVEFWIEGFSGRGIRSYLIEATLPEINNAASVYAARLLGEGTVVRLSATTSLKSGAQREKLDVFIDLPGRTQTYEGASKGQKRRLDLSLLLAFRQVIASRSSAPFDQLFADELFDGLDPVGVEAVGELLREIAAEAPVLLVTHDPRLKQVADRVITAYYEAGQATLLEKSYDGSN